MNLDEHWDGGEYLPPGVYCVTVKSHRLIDNASSPGVEFTVADERGRQSRVTFWITERAVWRLAQFAKACGLTRAEAKTYNPEKQNSHRVLHGRRCQVEVIKRDGKYSEVEDWWAMNEETTTPSPQPAHVVESDESVRGDDIPF